MCWPAHDPAKPWMGFGPRQCAIEARRSRLSQFCAARRRRTFLCASLKSGLMLAMGSGK